MSHPRHEPVASTPDPVPPAVPAQDLTVDLVGTPFAAALRWAVHALVYLLIALAAGLALAPPSTSADLLLVGLLVVLASVYSIGARRALRHSPSPRGSWWALGYLAPTILVWAVTLVLDPGTVWIAFGLDFAVLYALPTVGGVVALIVVTALAVLGYGGRDGSPSAGEIVGPVVGALVALAVVLTVRALQHEVDRRTRLARELAEARDLIAEQTRTAATAAERDRIARELHDTVAQSSLSIQLLLDAADGALHRADSAEAGRLLAEARAAARRTSVQTRRFVDDAEPELPTPAALHTELERIVARGAAEGDLDLRLRDELLTDPACPMLPRSLSRALARLTENLVANVVRHADARRAVVTVSLQGNAVLLDVVDHGRGFDLAAEGFGLRSARARAASVGGTMLVESAPGEGTAVQVSLPLPEDTPIPGAPTAPLDPQEAR